MLPIVVTVSMAEKALRETGNDLGRAEAYLRANLAALRQRDIDLKYAVRVFRGTLVVFVGVCVARFLPW